MSDNKHTPEPWEYWENDRTGFGVKMPRKKKTRFGAEPYAVIGGFEQEDRAEMKANARRIVACVNACAGCATEVLETAPVGFFNSAYGHPKYLEEIIKQRDELLAALDRCRFALEPYDDIKPRDWKSDRASLRNAHQLAVAVIASVKGEQ